MPRHPIPIRPPAAALCLLLASCGAGGGSPTAPAPSPGGGPAPPPPPQDATVLMTGTLRLPAAISAGDPGEHEVYIVNQGLRPDLEPTSGRTLVLELRDASRPGVVCAEDEPEGGCATVDWSGEVGEPGVPPDGLFVNRLQVELASGPREYYLSRTLGLAAVPDLIDPSQEHTAIGGGGVRWTAVLPADLLGDENLRLRVVLTKWQPPDVEIAYEVRVLQ